MKQETSGYFIDRLRKWNTPREQSNISHHVLQEDKSKKCFFSKLKDFRAFSKIDYSNAKFKHIFLVFKSGAERTFGNGTDLFEIGKDSYPESDKRHCK